MSDSRWAVRSVGTRRYCWVGGLSVISMLSAPNNDSPANVDAGVQFREDPAAFKRQVQRTVRRSQEEC